ncbi:MAG: peptide chain release factor N(5)-glutamine methyltransferase [Lachnospiraceae bacterium]|nr:peptide chain release factor N(5)-glutamine methyltransferase [Lachnospiraceae bacterium]
MNYSELQRKGRDRLREASIEDNESDSRLLLEHVFDLDRNFLYLHGSDVIEDEKAADTYLQLIEKRCMHIPTQHLRGKADFMGLEFIVNDKVLIPRIDTESLVEEAMLLLNDGMKVLDMCTGSGCILLSLMNYKNDIEGWGLDISEEALLVAKENAKRLGIDARFIKSDLFQAIEGEKFDMIISNPPYIASGEIKELMEEVRDHDPIMALDGGRDGLDFYRRISSLSKEHLYIGGKLLYEIGFDQGEKVRKILEAEGYSSIRIIKDLSGNDRVAVCERGLHNVR